jgi:hypothetical protein
MNQTIKAIPTHYKGYFFRSRLEARWAVFFDELGIEWVYEPEGYVLSDGVKYLPDFFLPKLHDPKGIFVEVKPERMLCQKAKQLSLDTGLPVLMACRDPGPWAYEVFPSKSDREHGHNDVYTVVFDSKYLIGERKRDEYRLYVYPGFENVDLSVEERDLRTEVIRAYNKARSARFESR